MNKQQPEDDGWSANARLIEMMRGLKISPAAATLAPGQLYLIARAVADQAKRVAELEGLLRRCLGAVESYGQGSDMHYLRTAITAALGEKEKS